ncbi:MAG: hypothetical protein GQ552_01285 [Flavobacteriaceae bacterium]|nr:hypothetical protein [Flavobacteriaceae bacterium]
MKKLKLIPFILVILFIRCDNIKKEKQATPTEIKQEIEKETKIQPKRNQQVETNSIAKPDSLYFNALLGKYPTQVNLFQNEILTSRLKSINRFDYDALIANWNTETPITIENQIIHSSGCKAHDCPSSGYELFIDLKNDNINIYHFRGNTLRVYTEKDWIDLPESFNNEIETKKSNAKIGIMDDDMKSTYNINPITYSPNNSNKETAKKISGFLKSILKGDLAIMTEDQRKFQYEEVDLNGDYKKEYLVGFKNSYFCGSGGCTFYLLHNDGAVITIFTVSDAPFIAMVKAKTNGWKDLLVKSDGSLRQLKFDGKTYPPNPSVAPKFTEIPSDDAYRLLWDEFPIPTFKF